MAMLKKMLVAAIACGAMGLAANAYAQAGGAGGAAGGGAAVGIPGMNSTTNNNTLRMNNNTRSNSLGLANTGMSGPAGTASQSSVDALNNLTANLGTRPGTTGTNLASNTANPVVAGGSLNANAGAGANSLFPGLSLGNTSTSQRSLTKTAMARVNARENQITTQLNRASASGAPAGVGTGAAQASTSGNTTTQ